MAKINSHLFQAAATILQGLLERETNRMPHDPGHAIQAKEIAEALYEHCKHDPVLTLAAARVFCGFIVNTQSAHCTPPELIALATNGVRNLLDSFHGVRPQVSPTQQVQQYQQTQYPYQQPTSPPMPNPPPQMPPPPPPPVEQPPAFSFPVAPIDVPDFSDGVS